MIAALTAATSLAGGMFGGDGEEGPDSQTMANRSPIHIAPVGFNFGAIVAPFNEGSPSNGGYGIDLPSRYQTIVTEPSLPLAVKSGFDWRILLLAGGAVGVLLLVMRR